MSLVFYGHASADDRSDDNGGLVMSERILVFIPAYNCESQIGRVLKQFEGREGTFAEILVVDNRSSDHTVDAALAAASQLAIPVRVVRNRENYGLGGSHKAAFLYAAREGYDYCVVLHGDDQGNIGDLIPLIEAGEHRRHDCLLGARFMPGSRLVGYSSFRTFGNRVFNVLFSIGSGVRLYDLGSGLNLYRVGALGTAGWLRFADNLTFNYYMVLASVHWQWKLRFFPITWREEDQISNVKLTRQSIQVLRILGSFIFKRRSFLTDNHAGRDSTEYIFSEVGRNRND